MAIARAQGSPWVVPSRDSRVWSSMKSSGACLYTLAVMVASEGHNRCMFSMAFFLFSELKALLASTRMTASSYIICIPKRNLNNEFILYFISRERRWSISKHGGLEIGLEFERNGFS